MDGGEEKIEDATLAAQLRRQATGIHARALIAVVLLAAILFLVLPNV
jgi:hypothetical protein